MECRASPPGFYSADRANGTGETPVAPPALHRRYCASSGKMGRINRSVWRMTVKAQRAPT